MSLFIGCNACHESMEQGEDGNYKCANPKCGKGFMGGPNGVSILVDDEGNTTIKSGTPKESDE